MAKYRKIDPRIWNDAKFSSLSHEAQRLFLYILTHPSMTSLGAFRATPEGLMSEIGIPCEQCYEQCSTHCKNTFDALVVQGMVKYDAPSRTVFAPNFLKYNAPENANVVIGWENALDEIPEGPLKLEALERAKASVLIPKKRAKSNENTLLNAFNKHLSTVLRSMSKLYKTDTTTVSNTVSRTEYPIQEQEQEQEQNIYNHNKHTTEISEAMTSENSVSVLDSSLKTQIESVGDELIQQNLDDPDHVLNPVEMAALARLYAIKLSVTNELREICDRRSITVDCFRRCVEIWKMQAKPTGYLIGILRNAALDPERYQTSQYQSAEAARKKEVIDQWGESEVPL